MNQLLSLCLLILTTCGMAAETAVSAPEETQILYLSGHGKDDGVPWEFRCTAGRNSDKWTTIAVPSCWECQGFGAFGYQQDPKPIEQGLYRRSFAVPAAWSGRSVRLVFEGVQTDTTVSVNGQPAGPMHIGGWYRFGYDITGLVKFGADNRVEVTVDKHSSEDSVNRAERQGDYWNFSGIYRPVYLESTPPQHLVRLAIDARADGALAIDAYVENPLDADRVEAQVRDLAGAAVGKPFAAPLNQGGATRVVGTIASARTWTAETPNLYQVELRLMRGATLVHRLRQRFGFRTIELRVGDGIYVNGQRVVIKGSCRHSFWPDSGRCTSEQISRDDIALMKDMNMNAVRMSHYPPDQHFLDACDELGLYVLDELGGWQKSYAAPIGHKLVGELIVRDVNHPSILFWDNGNEGGWNKELDDDFAQWDPQHRHVLHPWELFRDIDTKHYPTYDKIRAMAAAKNVFMPTEFMHGLFDGGAGAGLWDYWETMRASPVIGGGFIWAFLDEGVKRVDLDGRIDVNGNRAPDGIVGPYREKEASYYTIKRIWSPVVIGLAELPKDFHGDLPIENRYAFTELSRCSFTWELRALRSVNESTAGHVVIASGAATAPTIAPGASGTIHLDLPADRKKAEVLALRANDPTGHELWSWTWPLRDDIGAQPSSPGAGSAPTISDDDQALTVSVGELALRFDKASGYLVKAQRGQKVFALANGPRAVVGSAKLRSLVHRADGDDQVIEALYDGELVSTRWRVRRDGWIHLDYAYRFTGPCDYLGVGFDLPEAEVEGKRWLGAGPYRVWKNRLLGGTLDVWENAINDTMTGHALWQYPEFKGYFADVRWMQVKTKGGPITFVFAGPGRFVQVLTPKLPTESMHATTKFPDTGLAFLDAIAPIGNKFHKVEDTGPQGQRTVGAGDYAGAVELWFGEARK